MPYWQRGSQRVGEDLIAAAERSTRLGLEIAEGIGHLQLASIALDALSGLAQERGQWLAGEELSRRRLEYGTQVGLVEVIDAHSMVVWFDTVLGRLDEAERAAAAGMSLLQPGQIPPWHLHLAAWRTLNLALRGDWDRALAIADQARRLWLESGRPSAGYATRGFMAAYDIARSRRDEDLAAGHRAVIDEIRSHFAAHDPQE